MGITLPFLFVILVLFYPKFGGKSKFGGVKNQIQLVGKTDQLNLEFVLN